jgi:predicted alternative tryptophan synthase beta-subunit
VESLRITLEQSEIPTHWYNVVADMPNPPLPPLGPDGKPVSPEQMGMIFPMAILEQEMSAERWIPIPERCARSIGCGAHHRLIRARRLEEVLGTPARIYYKYEGVSPAGSHKPNTAVPQAFYNQQAGIKRITTETGAGQWGCSMAFAGQMFGLEVRVYMVKISYSRSPSAAR